jgi:hypothetical protein
MSGKMILYKLVVLGDGGVGKVGPLATSPPPPGNMKLTHSSRPL